MNAGQMKFYDYMIARTKEGHEEEMKELLADAFEKAATGEQTQVFFLAFNKAVGEHLKPEALPEATKAMAHFQSNK